MSDADTSGLRAIQGQLQRIVEARWFEMTIVALILVNALILGLETSAVAMARWHAELALANTIIVIAFALEAAMKIAAVAPRYRLYFGNGWNLFDFSIVVASLLPAAGPLASVARLMRLLRVARLITTIPELRLIVATLLRSVPGMVHIILLMSVLFYIYGVAGFHLYHEHDPVHWGTLGDSLLTLFRIVTLEDWTDVMYTAMQLYSMSWLFFVSFVVMGTFVVINLFIAVVLNNLDEAKQERLKQLRQPPTEEELIKALDQTRQSLARLEDLLDADRKRQREQ